jgi:hypothetical protein
MLAWNIASDLMADPPYVSLPPYLRDIFDQQ